ncbi:3095_t:CDS:2 [Dentiscutata erythropus]|uniref:3095_t:CDS:1 n=1 Tax=Dentiscutata erythropus TaxID=1348616 RepID=A0A9N8ZP52_9GLOM|nr:3095_t:CDS:2 [Dentiscutata erythropus]
MPPQLIFKELIIKPRLCHLLLGWCIDDNFSIHLLQDYKQDKDKIESSRFISTDLETNELFESIMHAYSSYFSIDQSLLKTKIKYYQNVSFSIIKSNGDNQYVKFRVGKVVETTLFDNR